jgi:hypothetical protein
MFGFSTTQEYVTVQDFQTFTHSVSTILKEKEDKIKELTDRIQILEQQHFASLSCNEKYQVFYQGFNDFLTTKQLEYLVPKMDRIGSSKQELINSLFTTMKRKTAEYDYDIDEIFSDRFKFTADLIEYLEVNRNDIVKEWGQIIKDDTV